MQPLYDYPDYQRLVEEQGKIIYGSRFRIHKIDEIPLQRMITYFIQDEERARRDKIRLGKGLMLCGPVGCGKSALMYIFSSMSAGDFVPQIISCRHIAMEYARKGHDVIRQYSELAFHPQTRLPLVYCFDSLGSESDMHFYGTPCNVMAEIITSRSELSATHRLLTHVTTQLDAVGLEKKYGKNVRSRMREMFNLIHFSHESPDKRR